MGVAWGLRGDPQCLSPLAVDAGGGLPGIRLGEAAGDRALILPLGRRWGGWEARVEDESCLLPGESRARTLSQETLQPCPSLVF